ncbi:proteobacterial dedicated sortase system histidine kinase [Alteromonas flava]|uniref:proteobacterial dedicated sortase system histidine kinase n=1 Tax=Alteromonas flava TaxID=2048003 RepID=UPI000C286EB6|nr:proteobacterial dedicated sortase system histidine kinase [Alteromonas flava]
MVRIPIRAQLLLMSVFLLAIPYVGYQYVWELESYLRTGQEQTMIGTARAIASALHEREALFDSPATKRESVRPGTDLYAVPIRQAIKLDGDFTDWRDAQPIVRHYDARYRIDDAQAPLAQPVSLTFDHTVGSYQGYVYAMFAVKDNVWIRRPANALGIAQNDHLMIAMSDTSGNITRYAIAPRQSGWVNGFKLAPEANSYQILGNENRIQGQWVETAEGYNIEIRFPQAMTAGNLAFAMVDVDESVTASVVSIIGTSDPNKQQELGTIATQSGAIERLLTSLQYTRSRVWVVDKHLRVLARAGDIQSATGINAGNRARSQSSWWAQIEERWLLPLYYLVLTQPSNDFIDELENAFALEGNEIAQALQGDASALWRLSPDNKAVILSAAHPIFIDEQVMGAVVVEQTTHGIRTLRNRALEKLFHVMLAITFVAIATILFFAARITNRIRKLRDATETIIDDSGRIVGTLPEVPRYDEIGDLSAAFSGVITRLTHYTQYLENMASRLSHELRTPVAIVRSSLDNLMTIEQNESQRAYTQRALSGIERLSRILTRMSEATRMEAALVSENKVKFDAIDVIRTCSDSYSALYQTHPFEFTSKIATVYLNGIPDLFAQLLDKVINNAVEFSTPGSPIRIHTWLESQYFCLSITNYGSQLPSGMEQELFQSMVSIRQVNDPQDTSVHLGLGLYIARTIAKFHAGELRITNLADKSGVCVLGKFKLDHNAQKSEPSKPE